jgi:C_GCAxxG_C_C family probable redox protein
MEKDTEKILTKAFESGKRHEMESGGCSQCALAGIFEALDVENADVFRAAAGFADGVGLTGNGHCGALSGGVMAISYLFGRKKEDFGDMMKLLDSCILSKKLNDQFLEKYGTCRCADIQTKFFGKFYNLYDPSEFKAAAKAGVLDTCSTLVGEVARMTTEIILEKRESLAEKQAASDSGSLQ